MLRLATAAVLAPLLWFFIREVPRDGFVYFALPMIGLSCWEAYRMLEARGSRPFKWLGLLAALTIAWSFRDSPQQFDTLVPLLSLIVVAVALALWRRSSAQEMADAAGSTLLPVLFVGLALAHLVRLRAVPEEDGQDLLLLLFFCVIMGDTVAYYVGSAIGRHKLAPVLSPKKSWEGALGGLAGCMGAAILGTLWYYQRLPWVHAVILGLILWAMGILGDLSISMLKRAVGVKDSSKLLPGHGGVLDRTDSLLFAAPTLYYYYRFFLMVGST